MFNLIIFTKRFFEKWEWLQKFSEYFKVDHMKRQKPNPTFCSIEWHEIVISGILTFTNELSFFGGLLLIWPWAVGASLSVRKAQKFYCGLINKSVWVNSFFLLLFWVESDMKKKLGRASWMSIKWLIAMFWQTTSSMKYNL